MATDVYIKFGNTKEKIGPAPRPLIEGDSTDELHYWWCEARSCNFDLEAKDPDPQPAEGGTTPEADADKSKAKFQKVTLKKRVDWASTQLFLRCCDQAMALTKSKDEQEKGWIDMVTVEVCRPAGGTKIPFVTVQYHKVRIIHYSIEMSGPEPSESITFEFQELFFQHIRTDPYTGNVASEYAITNTGELANSGTGQGGTAEASSGGTGGGSGTGSVAVVAAAAPPAGGPANPGGSATPAGPASPVEVAVNANFPGLWQGTGFGVLPD